MADEWYIALDDQQSGPFSPEDLLTRARSGKIGPGSLVRKGVAGKWLHASAIGVIAAAIALANGGDIAGPLISVGGACLGGLVLWASGELILLFLRIEKNTRATSKLLGDLLARQQAAGN